MTKRVRNPASAPGDWFIDTACIDCGAAPPATNPCDAAAQICGGGSQGGVQCSGQARCAAQCIVTLNSCDITNEPGLTECLNDC